MPGSGLRRLWKCHPRKQGLSRGLLHKEEVVEGDSKSLRGGIHFGHLGREEGKKRERERPGTGERKADRASLDSGWRGGKGTRAAGQAGAPGSHWGLRGKVNRSRSPALGAYEVARRQTRVGVRLPGSGVRWVSGRGGMGGREGREGRGTTALSLARSVGGEKPLLPHTGSGSSHLAGSARWPRGLAVTEAGALSVLGRRRMERSPGRGEQPETRTRAPSQRHNN